MQQDLKGIPHFADRQIYPRKMLLPHLHSVTTKDGRRPASLYGRDLYAPNRLRMFPE